MKEHVQVVTLVAIAVAFVGCRSDREDACPADDVCDSSCDWGADPDCPVQGCLADGQCNTDCGTWDPDCIEDVCTLDGICNEVCELDPDCDAEDPCAADGICASDCGARDPDCGGDCGGLQQPCCESTIEAPCIDELVCAEDASGAVCLERCRPTLCAYGEELGGCMIIEELSTGICLTDTPGTTTCELWTGGCRTEYGVATDTTCVVFEGRSTLCLEVCEAESSGCGLSSVCLPLEEGELGACFPIVVDDEL